MKWAFGEISSGSFKVKEREKTGKGILDEIKSYEVQVECGWKMRDVIWK